MSVFTLVCCGLVALIGAGDLGRAVLLWRDPTRAEAMRFVPGNVQGVLPRDIGLLLVGVGALVFGLAHPVEGQPNPQAVIGGIILALGLVSLFLAFRTHRYGRPRWMIPPQLRGQIFSTSDYREPDDKIDV